MRDQNAGILNKLAYSCRTSSPLNGAQRAPQVAQSTGGMRAVSSS